MRGEARFTARACAYSTFRPSYPAEAVDAILEGLATPVRALDLGAGTGISSRLLAERGFWGIAWADGTAENTGLAGQSVDLVAAFQAFHWFDAHALLPK